MVNFCYCVISKDITVIKRYSVMSSVRSTYHWCWEMWICWGPHAASGKDKTAAYCILSQYSCRLMWSTSIRPQDFIQCQTWIGFKKKAAPRPSGTQNGKQEHFYFISSWTLGPCMKVTLKRSFITENPRWYFIYRQFSRRDSLKSYSMTFLSVSLPILSAQDAQYNIAIWWFCAFLVK